MGELVKINKSSNELIKRRRKKKLIKKAIFLIIFLLTVLVTVCLKAPFFNVKNIEVEGNDTISKEDIVDRSKLSTGINVFYINSKIYKNNILSNPYILNVDIKRVLPSTIVFKVKERNALFYGESKGKYYILDKDCRLLEIRDEISTMNLVKLEGINYDNLTIGKVVFNQGDRKAEIIKEFSRLIQCNNSQINLTYIDLDDMARIEAYHNNMCIKLGGSDALENKLNKAINIFLNKPELCESKGYIDVSFNGNPVIFIEQ